MSNWLKVALLALIALFLPWDGIRHARQTDSALRASERRALSEVARTLATSLEGRTDLLYRFSGSPTPGPYDLTPVPLRAPLSAGDPEDWPGAPGDWRHYGSGRHRFDILTGVQGRMLYVVMKVRDPRLVFDAPLADPLRPSAMGERIWLGFADPQGTQHAEFFALTGPGPILARRIVTGEYGRQRAIVDPRIVGALQPHPGGFDVEFSMPLSVTDGQFGVLIDDRGRRAAAPLSYGTLLAGDLGTRGRLILASAALPAFLARFARPGLRLVVSTPEGDTLAQVDELTVPPLPAPAPGILARLYHRLVGPHGIRLTTVDAPIQGLKPGTVIATLHLTQSSSRDARLRNRTLERMLNLTLVTSCVAFLAALALAIQLIVKGWKERRRHARQDPP